MKKISTALFLSTLAGLSLGVAHTAQAQTAARFSTVEFKDTTLNDALEMVFQAANNPAHTIDPSASLVPIGGITLQNIQWDAALRTLANQNNFKVSRGADGSYLVEPREPVLQDGMGGMGMEGGMGGRGGMSMGTPGGNPFNPFGGGGGAIGGGGRMGGGGRGRGTMGGGAAPTAQDRVNFQMTPSVSTQANAQTNPRIGGAGGTNGTSTADQQVIPLYVRHIYVGGIAQLFQNSSTIGTQPFVSPASSSMGMGGMGMGGMGMGGMGMGGMGGGMMGGMGGMGMGGMSGGFGGGGFGFGF